MSKPKGGLGKGLGALIPVATSQLTHAQVEDIVPNPRQPRHNIDAASLEELASSIREHGVIQPLLVAEVPMEERPLLAGARYQLIAGERRWQAAKIAGLTRVPVVIKEATPDQALQLALVENIQRADLTPLEEALAYRQLADEFGLTQEKIAARVGKNRVSVANALRLLNLGEEARAALAAGKITEGHARALLGLESTLVQAQALGIVLAKALSVRETEELVRRLGTAPRRTKGPRQPSQENTALEDEFRSALGTKVNLLRSAKGGKLVIHFYSQEEFEAIYEAIVKRR
ncbi:MAG: ParB/RepB/Spo0J family partition protein [Chloroflexi bacterium]|nr:ParB/RepB/Spo0J family partition protein [Chloroflexota bacterium]